MVTRWSVNSHRHSTELRTGNRVDARDGIGALKAVGESSNPRACCNAALRGAPADWVWSLGKRWLEGESNHYHPFLFLR